MSLGRLNFDEVSQQDLQDLIATGVSEGISIEYKRDAYGRADAAIKEFLKDVTALANSMGGHIVIGMDETDGMPTGLKPIDVADRDAEIQRLENLIRDGIEPRIFGVRIRAVEVLPVGYVLVLRVPKSWNPPHRVAAKGTNRFYLRNSAGAHEASVDELRVLFNLSATAFERARAFRAERLAKILSDEGPTSLAIERGKLVLHIVPLSAFSNQVSIDPKSAFEQYAKFGPISATSMTPRINFDGFINIRGGNPCYGYTQMFRNGIVEATKCAMLREHQSLWRLPTLGFEQYLMGAIRRYLGGMNALGIDPPLIMMATLEGMHGAVLGVSHDQDLYDPPEPITRSILELPEIVFESYGANEEYDRAIRPAIDALWNAGGYVGSENYDSNGKWTGRAE